MEQNEKVYVHVLFLFPIICGALSTCPNIITRNDWNAREGLSKSLEQYPATHVLLHHSSTATCNSPANCAALVRSIQKIHMNRKRYRDIGYNFLIGEDGNIYEGVGWGKQGTHEDRLNSRSMGICFIGDYTSYLPNEAALGALQRLLECGVEDGHLTADYKLITHRQVTPTDCPGHRLYTHMRGLDHWVNAP